MLNLPDSFFEDEVREGFYIPACVKQAWGAQLSVLSAIDELCSKYGIHYFADWGTYLGAIRHGGFIPWDDDMDIGMLRADYERFLEVRGELPDGFSVYNLRFTEGHDQFLANVVNTVRICFEPEHLTKYHGFPYIACVDIFIIDNVSDDAVRQKDTEDRARTVVSLSDGLRSGALKDSEISGILERIERENNVTIPRKLKGVSLAQHLDCLAERIVSEFVDEETSKVVQMIPWGLNKAKVQEASWYQKFMYLKFEDIRIPVPCSYIKAMQARYGDFMKVIKNAGAHNYPYFEAQKENFIKLLNSENVNFEFPEYKFDRELLECMINRKIPEFEIDREMPENVRRAEQHIEQDTEQNPDTYKSTVNECLTTMLSVWNECRKAPDEIENIAELLDTLQNLAIDLGTYMESVKGEGYDIVTCLEALCEKIYILYQNINVAGAAAHDLEETLFAIKEKIERRKEFIFLPFKASNFKAFESEYSKAVNDENVDVRVIPIPYYYKNYDGSLRDIQYNLEDYPEELNVLHCDNYDFELCHPDRIYIQYPYDNENPITGIPPFLYAPNLRKYTDELIYIPWFKTCEFDKSNPRDYKNMKYYCLMPGVAFADKVLVQSEQIRTDYIERLTEWAGEDTKDIWKQKIYVLADETDIHKRDGANADEAEIYERDGANTDEADIYDGDDSDGNNSATEITSSKRTEKRLLFNVEAGSLTITDTGVINKIERVMDIFAENADKIKMSVLTDEDMYSQLKEINPEMYEKFMELVSKNPYLRVETSLDDIENYDAYYGDPGAVAHKFVCAKKPVMIMNYEI